jgi:hypothetical protein
MVGLVMLGSGPGVAQWLIGGSSVVVQRWPVDGPGGSVVDRRLPGADLVVVRWFEE